MSGAASSSPRVRVAFSHTFGDANPYTRLLMESLAGIGAEILPFCGRDLVRRRCDIWHLQWPESVARRTPRRRALDSVVRLFAYLVVARIRRIGIVWTVHNVQEHELLRPRLDRFVRSVLARSIHAWISLSDTAADEARDAMPALGGKPCFVIPHGHYRDAYQQVPPREWAREQLGLPHDATVVLFFGLIRPYKNVPGLIQAFREVALEDWRLIIAGKSDAAQSCDLRRLTEGDSRIRLELRHIDDEDVPTLFSAADLVALPFLRTLNSGSAILGLSFDRPILVPDQGSMRSLHESVGARWVTLYQGGIRGQDLERSLARRLPDAEAAPLDHLSWPNIGSMTMSAYLRILAMLTT